MTTILDRFAEAVTRNGNRPAIVEADGREISFGELDLLAQHYAAGFRKRGIGHGDRILLAMPVGIDLFACLAAVWRLGATVVFPEPAMGLKGLRHAATAVAPKAFLSSGWYRLLGWFVPELRALDLRLTPRADTGEPVTGSLSVPEDIALISFTSGSTGEPKAIARSHSFMMAQARAISPLLETDNDDERDLVAFPVFVLVCLSLGITSVLPAWKLRRHDKASADVIAGQIARQKITRLLVPPVICETLSTAVGLPGLRAIFTGGGPVFPDVLEQLASLDANLRLVSVYGSTEAEPIAHLEFSDVGASDLEAMQEGAGLLAGRPVEQIAVQIVDGEIQVAGDHVNESYLDAAQNAENKVLRGGRTWHRTGDAGRFDGQGRLWLLGRSGNRVGDIDPFSVETAARFWPGLQRSALVAVEGKPVLAVAGDRSHMEDWKRRALRLGIEELRFVDAIPMDNRHRSKVDMAQLRKLL
ncbi:MAG: AMP-binding protein, partial [Pseudomonadota bacterium]